MTLSLKLSAFLLVLIVLNSCEFNSVYEKSKPISNSVWKIDSSVKFSIPIPSKGIYDIHYTIKNNTTYPYYNLYLRGNLSDFSRTLTNNLQEIILFESKTGRPYGKGFGGTMEHQFLAYKNISLEKGNYNFTLKQYMRTDSLTGIQSVGIKVLKSE